MADDGGNPEKEADKKIIHVYPLVKVKHGWFLNLNER